MDLGNLGSTTTSSGLKFIGMDQRFIHKNLYLTIYLFKFNEFLKTMYTKNFNQHHGYILMYGIYISNVYRNWEKFVAKCTFKNVIGTKPDEHLEIDWFIEAFHNRKHL
jgi:hypothetical protein